MIDVVFDIIDFLMYDIIHIIDKKGQRVIFSEHANFHQTSKL